MTVFQNWRGALRADLYNPGAWVSSAFEPRQAARYTHHMTSAWPLPCTSYPGFIASAFCTSKRVLIMCIAEQMFVLIIIINTFPHLFEFCQSIYKCSPQSHIPIWAPNIFWISGRRISETQKWESMVHLLNIYSKEDYVHYTSKYTRVSTLVF